MLTVSDYDSGNKQGWKNPSSILEKDDILAITASVSQIGPKIWEVFKEYPKEDINYKSIYNKVVFLFSQLCTYHDKLNFSSIC